MRGDDRNDVHLFSYISAEMDVPRRRRSGECRDSGGPPQPASYVIARATRRQSGDFFSNLLAGRAR